MTKNASRFIPVCEPYLAGNEKKYVQDCLDTGWISSSGKYVTAFEEAFAQYSDMPYGIAVCNGTLALHLALVALGIGKGDEVILPSFTMIASAYAVCYTGAKAVFVDACPDTWNMDTKQIEAKITKKTKAIMPVHIFGNPCNMQDIQKIADAYNLFIVEDAAEAHGALYQGQKVGSFSDISAFSFFANKNLTTGEGGMVLAKNEELANKCRYYKNMCFPIDAPRLYQHEDIGFNYRISNLHAAIGLAQVEKADFYRDLRIKNAAIYKECLADISGITMQEDEKYSLNVHWMNGILVEPAYGRTKEALIEHLKNNGIETRLFFTGMHKQKALKEFHTEQNFPISDKLSVQGLYLPSASTLTKQDIQDICTIIKDFAL